MTGLLLNTFLIWFSSILVSDCLLYPQDTEARESKVLNGIWKFKISPASDSQAGFKQAWYTRQFESLGDYIEMPVPSSYNDITTNETIRDFVGWAWYQRSVFVPRSWLNLRVVLHFGSVHYNTTVWWNGKAAGDHEGGHVTFEFDVTGLVKFGSVNWVTVTVNNQLTNRTIPQGLVTVTNDTFKYPKGYVLYQHDFDYFDYAGINRDVTLYTTPLNYIEDISVRTYFLEDTGFIEYNITRSHTNLGSCYVSLEGDGGRPVAKSMVCDNGLLIVENVHLWWPAGSGKSPIGYLYILVVILETAEEADFYRLPVGFRTVGWTNSSILINGVPTYMKGFGMHEDSDIRGRGFDNVILLRDMNLIGWIGANAIRTSHYPYSTEFLYQADRRGIMVILETSACSLSNFDNEIYSRHLATMREIITIYKNHPSIVMWSLANEPQTYRNESTLYFRNLANAVRLMDPSRPVTFVTSQQIFNEKAVGNMDVVCLNRYSGWYQDGGKPELVRYQTNAEVRAWSSKYNAPVIVTEYGAGALSGLHNLPSTMWTEDYQRELLSEHFKAFDDLKNQSNIAGEMIWNFADFNTPQEYIRPGGCDKGLFTRSRQPKSAAHLVRARYLSLH